MPKSVQLYYPIVVVGTADGQIIQGKIVDDPVTLGQAKGKLENAAVAGAWLTPLNWFAPTVIIEGRIMTVESYDRMIEQQRQASQATNNPDTPPQILTLDK